MLALYADAALKECSDHGLDHRTTICRSSGVSEFDTTSPYVRRSSMTCQDRLPPIDSPV